MNKKWIIYIVLIVVAFVLIVVFSKNIYFWLSNQLWKILLLAAVFGGGWLRRNLDEIKTAELKNGVLTGRSRGR